MGEKIVQMLNRIGEVVKDKPTPERVAITASRLLKYPSEAVIAVLSHGIDVWVFFPSPAEIIALIEDTEVDGEEEWQKIMDHMKNSGYFSGYPKNLTPHSLKVLQGLGSWRDLCQQETSQLNFTKSHFIRAFKAMDKRAAIERQLPSGGTISGLSEGIGQLPK